MNVRPGFARNFLLARGKALRATESNKKHFESQRAQLEARNLDRKKDAEAVAEKLNGQSFILIRQSGETGVLYGSVSTRDLAEVVAKEGFTVDRGQFILNQPIKTLGLHTVPVVLHPEVEVQITVNVARSPEEASVRRAASRSPSARRSTSTTSAWRSAWRWPMPAKVPTTAAESVGIHGWRRSARALRLARGGVARIPV